MTYKTYVPPKRSMLDFCAQVRGSCVSLSSQVNGDSSVEVYFYVHGGAVVFGRAPRSNSPMDLLEVRVLERDNKIQMSGLDSFEKAGKLPSS